MQLVAAAAVRQLVAGALELHGSGDQGEQGLTVAVRALEYAKQPRGS